jgi:hypothetical protein
MELWNYTDRGNPKKSEKNLSQRHLSTTSPIGLARVRSRPTRWDAGTDRLRYFEAHIWGYGQWSKFKLFKKEQARALKRRTINTVFNNKHMNYKIAAEEW